MDKSVLIVGAGPGGLASAMLLASQGLNVTILESRDRVGGRTSTITTDEGYRFDLGPTFFLYPEILEQIFSTAGYDLHQEVEMVRLDPQYHLKFEGDGDLLCSPNVAAMQKQVAQFSQHDADRFPDFLRDNRKKFEAFKPILQRGFDSWKDVVSIDLLKMLPLVRPWASVDKDLRRYFDDPRIRLAFSFQSKYLGMSPFSCPSLFTILSYLEYDYGIYHPMGGCGAVSQAMARCAQSMGVDIRLNEAVEEVLIENGQAAGVRTSQDTYKADRLVINADFANAMSTMIPNSQRRKYKDAKLEKKKYSCSTFMMYLGIEGDVPDDLHHHTIFLANNYEQNLRDIEKDHVLSQNPSVYVQHAGATDASMAPEGHTSLYVLAPVTHQHGNVQWNDSTVASFRQTVLNQLGKFGLGDLESRIRYEKVVTPRTWQADYAIYKGATFNLAHNLTQMLHLRPHNRFEEIGNTYLVGGGTHPGSGLPVIYESARISTQMLLKDMGYDVDWHRTETMSEQPTVEAADVAPLGSKDRLLGV